MFRNTMKIIISYIPSSKDQGSSPSTNEGRPYNIKYQLLCKECCTHDALLPKGISWGGWTVHILYPPGFDCRGYACSERSHQCQNTGPCHHFLTEKNVVPEARWHDFSVFAHPNTSRLTVHRSTGPTPMRGHTWILGLCLEAQETVSGQTRANPMQHKTAVRSRPMAPQPHGRWDSLARTFKTQTRVSRRRTANLASPLVSGFDFISPPHPRFSTMIWWF